MENSNHPLRSGSNYTFIYKGDPKKCHYENVNDLPNAFIFQIYVEESLPV